MNLEVHKLMPFFLQTPDIAKVNYQAGSIGRYVRFFHKTTDRFLSPDSREVLYGLFYNESGVNLSPDW